MLWRVARICDFIPDDLHRGPHGRLLRLARFSNITAGLVVDGEVWMGSFSGDRLAVTPVPGPAAE